MINIDKTIFRFALLIKFDLKTRKARRTFDGAYRLEVKFKAGGIG